VTGDLRTKWLIHGERLVDENPHIRLSVATVELPDGTVFDQYVMRMRRAAMTVVLDESRSHVLLVWRHRFIIDRRVWELPGGYADPAEEESVAALRRPLNLLWGSSPEPPAPLPIRPALTGSFSG